MKYCRVSLMLASIAFRPAADQVSVGEAAGFIADQTVGQRLGRLGREKAVWA